MREKIYETAKEAFRTYGYKNATVERIAGMAGVPTSLVSYYFKKEELLLQICRDFWLKVTDLVDQEAGEQCENRLQWYLLFNRVLYSSLVSDVCPKDIYQEIFLRRVAEPLLQEYSNRNVERIIAELGLGVDSSHALHCVQAERGARREVLYQQYLDMDPHRSGRTFYFLATIGVCMAGLSLEECRRHSIKAEELYIQMGRPLIPLF